MRLPIFHVSLLVSGILANSPIVAHSPMDYQTMKPRTELSNVKTSVANIDILPCGPGDNDIPGLAQHSLKAGDTFEVNWVETIDHPAKYLIDLTSQDAVNDPLSADVPQQIILSDLDGFYNDEVIPQNMADKLDRVQDPRTTTVAAPNPNAVYKIAVQIPPDVKCTKCTVRLMQKMFDAGSVNMNTVYTHCTDVTIAAFGEDAGQLILPAPTDFTVTKINK